MAGKKSNKQNKNSRPAGNPGMMSASVSPARKVMEVLYPLLLYYVLMLLIMFGARGIIGSDSAHYMICQSLVAIIMIPIMYTGFYKPDTLLWGRTYQMQEKKPARVLLLLLALLLIGTGLNNLISMSPLVTLSDSYAQANENFYGSSFAIEFLASGLLAPILEELTFRGIIYVRARRIFGLKAGMLLSALLFALVHFNLVQFPYSFLMGLLFALLLERTGSLYLICGAHMLINILAICRTEFGWLSATINGSASAWIVSLAFLAAGLLLLGQDLKTSYSEIFKTNQ